MKGGIDFDGVERELIQPALATLGVSGRTSAPLFSGGNIQTDMFESLLSADVVLADVSIENANVFYELGLAHALRQKRTILISGLREGMPLDLELIGPYLRYDPAKPSASVPELFNLLQKVLQSDRIDSPVYMLLPGLRAPQASPVPPDFRSELDDASKSRDLGHLRLLSQEIRSFHWVAAAAKQVGDVQLDALDLSGARETLEYLLSIDASNADAHLRLATIYQRLQEPRRSDEAIRSALGSLEPKSRARAEAYALLGRNAKARWQEAWRSRSNDESREAALRSHQLLEAYEHYLAAYREDLNSYYGGLNALALGTILRELAEALPDVWEEMFDGEAEAAYRLATLRKQVDSIVGGLALSLDVANSQQEPDGWLQMSMAEFELLTSERPARVAERYRRAASGASPFVVESARSQVAIYHDLGLRSENARSALQALGGESTRAPPTRLATVQKALLFVGHAIDAPGRATPRFPAHLETSAKALIQQAVLEEVANDVHGYIGVAGGSSGGDILFHEVCELMRVTTRICLALPLTDYVDFDFSHTGVRWEMRLRELISRNAYQVFAGSAKLPGWLRSNAGYDFWGRETLWRYHTAAAVGDVTVIALWDGKDGAAADLVRMAKERGAKVIVLHTDRIFGTAA